MQLSFCPEWMGPELRELSCRAKVCGVSSSVGGLDGAALAGSCSTSARSKGQLILKQTDYLWEGYGGTFGFTKSKGEKFSPASEELESGTAKSCLWLFPSLTASPPRSSIFGSVLSVRGSAQLPWLLRLTTKCESPSWCEPLGGRVCLAKPTHQISSPRAVAKKGGCLL